jgi:hypothetical protein
VISDTGCTTLLAGNVALGVAVTLDRLMVLPFFWLITPRKAWVPPTENEERYTVSPRLRPAAESRFRVAVVPEGVAVLVSKALDPISLRRKVILELDADSRIGRARSRIATLS